ncbi:MAG: signal peptidase I [Ruminococcus sp.]|nr:signal peptidase I [Ruminococcus sp.]
MTEPADGRRSLLRRISDIAGMLLITLFISAMLFTYVVQIYPVTGDSMLDTLRDGDRVLVLPLSMPEPGDIAVIDVHGSVTLDENGEPQISAGAEKLMIKRVIAVGGQTVDIDFERGSVTVDGKMLDEEYLTHGLTHMDSGAFTGQYPVTVPDGYVFVMGDNRPVSRDSRSADMGFVPESDILGRVVRIVLTPGRNGAV